MKNTKLKSLVMVSGTMAALLSTSQAAVLIGWDNNTASAGDDPWAATYLDASLSGGSIDMSDGLVAGPRWWPRKHCRHEIRRFCYHDNLPKPFLRQRANTSNGVSL